MTNKAKDEEQLLQIFVQHLDNNEDWDWSDLGRKEVLVLSSDSVVFTTTDGDQFYNIVYRSDINELQGDAWMINKDDVDEVKHDILNWILQK